MRRPTGEIFLRFSGVVFQAEYLHKKVGQRGTTKAAIPK
jgi:hypothetical protein